MLVGLVAMERAANARAVEYMSQHPLPRKVGHGFCYIDVPHFHDFPPSDPRLYRQVDGQYYFVGDPAPFEYEGPRYAYYGPHPVAEADVQFDHPVYCYLRGPHYHWYQPTPQVQASFELKGGAYWYVGTYPQTFYDERPRYVTVNEAYAPIVYARPVVDVTVAPPAFHGEIVAAAPGFRAGIAVGAPAVGVYVAPPPPVQVGVGINFGGPPAVVEERRVIEERRIVDVHEHHDNGRHEGWYKHGHERENENEQHERGEGWRGPQQPPPPHGGAWRGVPAPGPAAPAQHGWTGPGHEVRREAQQGGHGGPPSGGKHGGGWKR
jgi:hypothetical protein